jgi:hypothetical protein
LEVATRTQGGGSRTGCGRCPPPSSRSSACPALPGVRPTIRETDGRDSPRTP